MITIKDLEANGYRSYKSHKGEGLWSKWFRSDFEDNAKLYAVNFYLWKLPGQPDQFSAEVRFYQDTTYHPAMTHEKVTSFDINLMIGETGTIKDIEAFFGDAYVRLDCIADPHNQD